MSKNLRDMITSFNGDGDVSSWLKKVKLVARLRSIDDLATVIPLFLEGPAFALFDQIAEKDQGDAAQIEKVLLQAFAQDQFSAYESFRQRNWVAGETVDVYLADLRRLASLVGVGTDERLILSAFVVGLPQDVSAQLRASSQVDQLSTQVLLEKSRVYMAERVRSGAAMSAVPSSSSRAKVASGGRQKITCWRCNGKGHIARDCTVELSDEVQGNASGKLPSAQASSRK